MKLRRAGDGTPVSPARAAAFRDAQVRPPVTVQVDSLAADVVALERLGRDGDPRARGAALEVAFAALRLAVTAAPSADGRARRRDGVQGAMPFLARAGLGHVADLAAAALACDVDPVSVSRGTERLQ